MTLKIPKILNEAAALEIVNYCLEEEAEAYIKCMKLPKHLRDEDFEWQTCRTTEVPIFEVAHRAVGEKINLRRKTDVVATKIVDHEAAALVLDFYLEMIAEDGDEDLMESTMDMSDGETIDYIDAFIDFHNNFYSTIYKAFGKHLTPLTRETVVAEHFPDFNYAKVLDFGRRDEATEAEIEALEEAMRHPANKYKS
ncbi:MAG: hypothetical protein EOP06_02335 [Proteobacteria bacterium]|nr:MAG: hypothetical protein EOP06_02335 [Pseudomonadota bacterium]